MNINTGLTVGKFHFDFTLILRRIKSVLMQMANVHCDCNLQMSTKVGITLLSKLDNYVIN